MTGQFDVLVTVDKSLRFQHLLTNRPVGVVVLRAKSNRIDDLARLIPALRRALNDIVLGAFKEIEE